MTKRIVAIAFIYACTTVGWMILGATIFSRTQSSDQHLRGRVGSTWGTKQEQKAPTAYVEKIETRTVDQPLRSNARGETDVTPRTQTVRTRIPVRLEQTRASVAFDLDHRQKGLLWYSTYAV